MLTTFMYQLCYEVARLCNTVLGQNVGVELFANYDAGRESGLKVTVCPVANLITRSGRNVLADQPSVVVVFQLRVPYPAFSECETAIEAMRACALNLADTDITVGSGKYFVDEVEANELFDQAQLEEANVYSGTITIRYKTERQLVRNG